MAEYFKGFFQSDHMWVQTESLLMTHSGKCRVRPSRTNFCTTRTLRHEKNHDCLEQYDAEILDVIFTHKLQFYQ